MTLLHTYGAILLMYQGPTASPTVLLSTYPDQFNVVSQLFHLYTETHQQHERRKKNKNMHIVTIQAHPLTTLSAINFRQYTLSACHGRSVSILYIFKSHIYPPIIRNFSQFHKRGTTNLECTIHTSTNHQPTISTPCKPAVLFDAPQIPTGMHRAVSRNHPPTLSAPAIQTGHSRWCLLMGQWVS